MPHPRCETPDDKFIDDKMNPLEDQMAGENGLHPAFQWYEEKDSNNTVVAKYCVRVSRRNLIEFDLLEKEHPTRGVKLIYHDGDWTAQCNAGSAARPRKLVLELECGNNPISSFEKQVEVEEGPERCSYHLRRKVITACPRECVKSGSNKYCGGQGHCSVDTQIKQARCFCNVGYQGEFCEEENPKELPSTPSGCQEVTSNGMTKYLQGGCSSDGRTLDGTLFTDPNCNMGSTSVMKHFAVSQDCVTIFNDFRAQISCFGHGAILDHRACPAILTQAPSEATVAQGISAWVIVMCLLLMVLLGVSLYMCYKQTDGVQLKNYLVLDENRGSEMAVEQKA